ncbi:DUF4886 domain-containing protein [Blastopirellula sp. JC732]|uniref:DUF4886 domain-containing protein n=1 Tax=Blastopirellula sediminis TaxID=2894196 RepID=A0A9X1SHK0_9BACT|nr:DUF4886 domain-containing protein [Blastopirellula sediminis]MCC9607938.1 DUF4886 domain-containing protein [Blastopirellula sediminis]MCC9627269.1 DUF4886 domain-containing protein [Blastopirellula sediminis]
MSSRWSKFLCSLIAALVVSQISILAMAEEPTGVRTVRLLTIGNSFADNACAFLPQIFAADPKAELVLMKANLGGCSLERHWNNAAAAQQGDGGKVYSLVRGKEKTPATLQQMLAAEPWDVVTIQQVSNNSWRPDTYHPYIENLVALVGKESPQAQIALHQTWAYRTDAPLLAEWQLSQEEMYEKLTDAYSRVAKKFDVPILPSGSAIQTYRRRDDRQYVVDKEYDFQASPTGPLPKQDNSLVVGWYRSKDKTKLLLDPKHLNDRGEYLIGAVWYEALTGHDIRENSFVPKGIPAEELKLLQEVAHQTVADFKQPAKPLTTLQK